jgi:monoamine oxidase
MLSRIQVKPQTNKRVTGLGMASGGGDRVFVKVENEPMERLYDHVISTLPFGCFRALDTRRLSMPYTVQQAIKGLQYCSGLKIAMRFATRWWERLGHKGGTSITDRPLRLVVYPSYGIGSKAATMIVSYTWTQDASTLDAFVRGSTVDPHLRDIILYDLAEMHSLTFEYLRDEFRELHAKSWATSEFSVGQ